MSQIIRAGLDGAKLKVERAYRHIDEFKDSVDGLRRTEPKRIIQTVQANGSTVLDATQLGRAGMALSLQIGDAIHNLRSALDHTWTALARGIGLTGFPTFPFHETRKNLEDMIDKSAIAQAFPDTRRLILDEIKPHRDAGGNEVFWTITKFDKIDKHNLLVPTIEVTKVECLRINTGGMVMQMTDCDMSQGIHIGMFGDPVEFEDDPKLAFEITFPTASFLPGEAVLPALINMAEAADKAVDLFRDTFL